MKHFKIAICLILTAYFSLGCMLAVGAAAGAGGYYYVRGEVRRDYTYPLTHVYQATLGALQTLEIKDLHTRKDSLKAEIKGYMADGAPVKIYIKRLGDNSTKVRVRVGKMGDHSLGRIIHEQLQKNL